MIKAVFFDMDGVIFNSMPYHAKAWEQAMHHFGFDFNAYDAYINEGRTGESVINEYFLKVHHRNATAQEVEKIYKAKTDNFNLQGELEPIEGIHEVLKRLKQANIQIWIVTGSGQKSLFDKLNRYFPDIFASDRMITAFDVKIGKPDKEPYWKALLKSGVESNEAIVIENAPLGVRAGKAAGLFTIAVNTGPLDPQELVNAGADLVMPDMHQLLNWINNQTDI